jgi:alpha-galactosidase
MFTSNSVIGHYLLDGFPVSPPGRFATALQPGLGLSLSHSGLSHEETVARLSRVDDVWDESEAGHPVRQVQLEDHESGLLVTVAYQFYPQHQAVLYGATLLNGGRRNIEHLSALRSCDVLIAPLQRVGSPRVHTIGGGLTHSSYPPLAYRLQESFLLGPTAITIDSGPSGRSSNKDLPFFFVEDEERTSGLYGGIEWSGLWHFGIVRRDEPYQIHYGHLGPSKSLWLEGGMDGVDLTLRTGETFEMPRMLIGFFEGGIAEGRNALRRFIGDWAPRQEDEAWIPWIQATPGGYICPTEMTHDVQSRAHASANAEIGAEFYVIENWFQSLADRPLTYGATGAARGTWRPDPVRYPDMDGFAEFTRCQGMEFGLWTDMEVAHAESEVAREHPEWVLYLDGNPNGLLNLGLHEAQDWAIATYERLIQAYGLKWIFYDNNINPRPYWDAHESAQRRGRMQHDYIRGVWRVWEEVVRRHPDVVFENCSSGGRRIDLGTLARAHCSFTSDQFRDAHMIRYQFSGANTVLPGARILNAICKGLESYPDCAWHANFAGMICISEGVEGWSPGLKQQAARHFEVYKTIRRFLDKDYYPLFPQPQSLEAWDGWQFHDPEADEGFVLVFRVHSPDETATPALHAIRRDADYLLTDPYTGEERTMAGNGLADTGLQIALPLEGTSLLCYRCA